MRDFNHTIDVLVKSYLNDTLQHCNTCGCAVGNIVADSCNIIIEKKHGSVSWVGRFPGWPFVFSTDSDYGTQDFNEINYKGLVKVEIDSTGYTLDELMKIEFAFEMAGKGNSDDEYMLNGLMAVVDVLADIHGIDLEVREETKKLFVKA